MPFRTLTVSLLATLAFITYAHAAPDNRWVQASWADVRNLPDKGAPVIANWTTNTAVNVEQQKEGWCLASSVPSNQSTDAQVKGYVACNELGDRPLTLRDMNTWINNRELLGQRESRSFWIAPSVRRFADVGSHLNYLGLSAEQDAREKRERMPVRFVIPEFEAMKQRLIKGVVPKPEQELSRVNINTYKSFDDIPDWLTSNELLSHLKTFNPELLLPSVKPSLFKQHSDVLLSGESGPDTVSAMLGQKNKIEFGGEAKWDSGHYDEGVSSIWDIGWINVQYAQPVSLHSVSHKGLVSAITVSSTVTRAISYDESDCIAGYPQLPAGDAVAGFPRIESQPLISFILPKLLPDKQVNVLTRKVRATVHVDPYSGPKNPQSRLVWIHTIDLDRDDIPDMAVFEWSAPGLVVAPESLQRYMFINVSGAWWYAGYERYSECGC